jgi:hypothetical protein
MKTITDEYMKQMRATTREYTLVILKKGPDYSRSDAQVIIWEHGRRNFSLREEGLLSIVCPVNDDTEVAGVGLFNADMEHTRKIMEGDPAVQHGILVFEIHPTRSFAGDKLP